MMFMNITIGYEMDEEERNSILEENGCSVDDYDSEDEAYMEAAELKFNEGLGCSVELSQSLIDAPASTLAARKTND